ncbi:MAG: HAD family hydrolase [Oscillospiraceae bacterium]|nr:HAD family hydrolase [Oscillospiraceae bacterium]
MAIKAVLFDLDGTLLNTLSDLTDSVNFMLENFGFPTHSEQKIRSIVGHGVKNLISRALPPDASEELFEKALSTYKAHYETNQINKTAPYAGIPAMLRELKSRGIKLAIVSNKHNEATQFLSRHYFGDLIDFTIGNCDFLEKKPAPDMANYVLDKLDISKNEAVFAGDAETDILTAKNAGLPCITVTWGFRDRDELIGSGAEIFVDEPKDFISVIENLQ